MGALRVGRRVLRRVGRDSRPVRRNDLLRARFRRLACELLEDRRLLSLGPDDSPGAGAIQLFGVSPALFVENQGQWPDPSVRYAFHVPVHGRWVDEMNGRTTAQCERLIIGENVKLTRRWRDEEARGQDGPLAGPPIQTHGSAVRLSPAWTRP